MCVIVIGDLPGNNYMIRFIAQTWSQVADPEVFLHDNGYYIVKFQDMDNSQEILCAGPYSKAMEEELLALKENNICPSNVRPIGCKWFYSIKLHADGTLDQYNAGLVAGNLIALAGLQESPSVDTPLKLNVKYRCDECDLLPDPTLFRQLVGSLNYLTIIQADISFVVQQASQFMQTPRHLHLLNMFSDSDWAECPDTRRSITGWYMFLGDYLISWKSKKQDRVSKSLTESEYRAMPTAWSEIIQLRGLLA
ncbi:uncharacterized mitochondrial protein AtMg00810-like [Lycium barbarum]|uniref:uncharacterized mitochondrial protein AtMg00810-like n=1 Tax=Lycium barbarum TaxID=112863 RepID=UPI00293F5743|nr:uncharacterized mitochondrial protein AtMg00810-like [Lycium barbarum]